MLFCARVEGKGWPYCSSFNNKLGHSIAGWLCVVCYGGKNNHGKKNKQDNESRKKGRRILGTRPKPGESYTANFPTLGFVARRTQSSSLHAEKFGKWKPEVGKQMAAAMR